MMDEIRKRISGTYAAREREQLTNSIPYEPPTIKESMINRRDVLLEELQRLDAAIKIFETEPRVTDALETIMKAMR